jgi:hypothetical protein
MKEEALDGTLWRRRFEDSADLSKTEYEMNENVICKMQAGGLRV